MITPQSFRRDFTEFANKDDYNDNDIILNLRMATVLLNQSRWGAPATTTAVADYTEWDIGAEYFVAHHLALGMLDKAAAANGAPPGQYTGAVSSKSVDKASINYDVNVTLDEGAGHWNLTTYGKRFIRLCRMMGAGPVQVGANPVASPLSAQFAWAGPWTSNFPNPSGS